MLLVGLTIFERQQLEMKMLKQKESIELCK